jgi:ubiquinone biosynthesis protein
MRTTAAGRWRTAIAISGRIFEISSAGVTVAWAWRRDRASLPDALHHAIVRLGPTFVKLGQVASTRPDFVPPAISERLVALQERTPPFPFEAARDVVESELDGSLEERFGSFPEEPVASASLSQVYLATLPDGAPVAVKVQRPGIRALVERDIAILSAFASGIERVAATARRLRLARTVDEFGRWTLAELDFGREGQNAERFARNFAGWEDVVFPRVIWSHTTEKVLTLQRFAGLRVGQVVERFGPERTRNLARRLAEIEMKMFITDAFFHADLHPGNVFFGEDGEIRVLDVGMVGRMTARQRDRFLAYWIAISRRRRETAFRHLLALADSMDDADLAGFRAEYDRALDRFYDRTLSERSLARTYLDIVVAGAHFGIVFGPELVLQAKAMVTAEALQLVLAPDFRFTDEVRPIVARELARRASPTSILDRLWEGVAEWVLLGEWGEPSAKEGCEGEGSVHDDERRFRRTARSALADEWADATDRRLRENGRHLPSTRAEWWSERPETRVAARTAIAVLRAGADALARLEEEARTDGRAPEQSERPGVGEALVSALDRLDAESACWNDASYWHDRREVEAGLISLRALLRIFADRSARAAGERERIAAFEGEPG